MKDTIKHETFYFLEGTAVVLTAEFKDEVDARAHFAEWVQKRADNLQHIYTLVAHCVSVSLTVQPQLVKHAQAPKLEHMVKGG